MRFPRFCVVQFAKSPASPAIKTRLSAALDLERRRQLHSAMTRHIARTAAAASIAPLQLWVDGDPANELFTYLAEELPASCFSQQGSDLGARMHHAARQVLDDFDGVILIGSDCPFIDSSYLGKAASALRNSDAVLGPATDGGYVLLGLRRPAPSLFTDMPWGTDAVLEITEQRLRSLNWSWSRLPPLSDIDRPEDLGLLDQPSFPAELRLYATTA